ncbi:uncharacterized protein LOC110848853 [Folsomia candida]|uniref:Uncharacterized protein n=1 Tax=Folsomia candida TaxID=158441 RepID=A0A226EEA2_FOLCA|nr:uncharacterized protein LOC110848853 [Folsomia candida]OXA55578.1 hypothetical protein Fcan01_09004 [Folsomia candida]
MNKSTIIEILAICCVSTIATTLANKSQADENECVHIYDSDSIFLPGYEPEPKGSIKRKAGDTCSILYDDLNCTQVTDTNSRVHYTVRDWDNSQKKVELCEPDIPNAVIGFMVIVVIVVFAVILKRYYDQRGR